ncbi:unnamed protein product [Pleuronectes platessa]|uniref:Uncharacterized protein n=1 Tax=Pleuronectes platessa TaxID=8262 RepID=A0A9N7YII9_PLEPL|nr:unnamed protein product [Pleuronectes platessa]
MARFFPCTLLQIISSSQGAISMLPQVERRMPMELKYGAVKESHTAAEKGHIKPARGSCGELMYPFPIFHPAYGGTGHEGIKKGAESSVEETLMMSAHPTAHEC